MARKYDPTKVTDKQVNNVAANTQAYIDGVEAIQEHPGRAAVRKKEKMKRKWIASVDSGKWEEGVTGYSLDDYKNTAKTIGANRLSEGVNNAKDKILDFHTQLSDYISRTQADIDAIDDSTEAGADAKMIANRKRMSQFRRVRRRR